MRNLFVYYFIILAPFALLILALKFNLITNGWFVVLFLLYLPFRQFTDASRLKALGVIPKITWKVILNPFLQMDYFKELYWFRA